MEFTVHTFNEAEKVLTAEEVTDAINSLLQDKMMFSGRVDIGRMNSQDVGLAIHLLRRYRAILNGGLFLDDKVA